MVKHDRGTVSTFNSMEVQGMHALRTNKLLLDLNVFFLTVDMRRIRVQVTTSCTSRFMNQAFINIHIYAMYSVHTHSTLKKV
jgi:hypothetical protein